LRIERRVLAAVSGGDEGAIVIGAGEDDVRGLVADQKGAHHAGGLEVANVHDADAIGEMIHHPYLGGGSHRDGDGFEADGHGGDGDQGVRGTLKGDAAGAEDLEAIVRGIDGEQEIATGRKGERANLPGLEQGEGGVTVGRAERAAGDDRPGRFQDGQQECGQQRCKRVTFHFGLPLARSRTASFGRGSERL
jgi:hypothetical protein